MLPLPCVEGCGQPVTKDQTWHVAHLNPAMLGGKTTSTNVGPAHAKCNLRAGGRMGAAVTNAKRSTQEQTKEGRRSWL
jgi:5-methylcytosine-specific restriction endonuclease McrA